MKIVHFLWYQNWTAIFFFVIHPSPTPFSILCQFTVRVYGTPLEYYVCILLMRKRNRNFWAQFLPPLFLSFSLFFSTASALNFLFYLHFIVGLSFANEPQKIRVRLSLWPIFWRDICVVMVRTAFFGHVN